MALQGGGVLGTEFACFGTIVLFGKLIFVQGMGCAESGARVVLGELLRAAPDDRSYWVLCTAETARQFIGRPMGRLKRNVRLIGLSHAVFGRWLRLPLEMLVALLGVLRVVGGVVNLSHYGLCLGGHYALYIHSPLLMDQGAGRGWKDGDPNRIKRMLLNTCLRRARTIVLQTPQMGEQLRAYCARAGIVEPRHRVMRPRIAPPPDTAKPLRRHEVQLFYPTSRFVHKRAELAVAGAGEAARADQRIGLVITVHPDREKASAVTYLGPIERRQVWDWLLGSDALLFTSERETLGLPLLEALRANVPVIAPRLPYAMEILGDAGIYFEDATPAGVAAAVADCIDHLKDWREKTARRAAVVAAESADWATHWDTLLEGFPGVPTAPTGRGSH